MRGYIQGILCFASSDGAAIFQMLQIGLRRLNSLLPFLNSDIVPDPRSKQKGRFSTRHGHREVDVDLKDLSAEPQTTA